MPGEHMNPGIRGIHCHETAWLLPLLLLIATCGCYGPSKTLAEPVMLANAEEEAPAKPAPVPASPAPAAAKPAVAPSAAAPTVAPAGNREQAGDAPAAVTPPPKPKRPANLAEWTKDDLVGARKENDVMLPAAVQHVVRTWPKDEETVALLAAVLPRSEASPPPAAISSLTVAGLAIPYLAGMESEAARQALTRILRGETTTDLDDARAVELALRSMVQTISPGHEETLIDLLADPYSWRGVTAGGLKAETLHEACLKIVRPVASAALRTRLAERIVQDSTPRAPREQVGAWLAEPGPLNLGAQVVLHNSELLGPQHKARFREIFATHNSRALDQLLGVAPVATPVASTGGLFQSQAADGESQSLQMLQAFWKPEFLQRVSRDLARMNDLGGQRELMLLGSNLPHRVVREELYRALRRQWEDGTKPFETARLALDGFRDPGMLVLVKAMPREEKKQTPPGVATAASAVKPTPERQAKYAWMAATEGFVRTLNDRFHAAARSQPRGAAAANHEPQLTPHKNLSVTAEYHLNWPADLKDRLPDVPVDALVLHYVRMEGEERFQRVSDFYRRQMESPATRAVTRGHWLDSQQPAADSGRIRSVDVLITRDDAPPRSQTAMENLVVELLWIEIPDPTR